MGSIEMGGRYCICVLDARILRPGPDNYAIWCGVCPFIYLPLVASFECCPDRERAKDLMPPGQESLVIIVDYKSTTLRTNPSISVARKVRFLDRSIEKNLTSTHNRS